MLAVTFADLWFRARQFLIAVVGVGLVLALALGLSGLADGFHAEVASTVDAVGATSWVMAPSAHGRLTAFAAFPEAAATEVAREPGVHRASPVLFAPEQVVLVHGSTAPQTVNLIGVQPGGLGDPEVVSGHGLSGADQAVVDSKLHAPVGSVLHAGRAPLRRGRGGRRPHHGRGRPDRLHAAGHGAAGGHRRPAADHGRGHDGHAGRSPGGARRAGADGAWSPTPSPPSGVR